MKVVILAGGSGSRIMEETEVRPKALVEIGDKPIIWHIMKHYSHYGFKDFMIATGYKGEMIEQQLPKHYEKDWKVEYIFTGLQSLTGERIKRLKPYLKETFMLTWCDGLSDINLNELLKTHKAHGKLATVTAARPQARYGYLDIEGDKVVKFSEKPDHIEGWINGAFFVLEPEAIDYIKGENTQWEKEPMENLAEDGELFAYKHHSFWQCMDTLREKYILEQLWKKENPPWKTWK
ncbi:NTP transferase domain-containing protein [Candidatus Woesearchaeota archaeon]|nr:NTP transferase domain-containing protein [Candidatus Woesearchaeota archaeon]